MSSANATPVGIPVVPVTVPVTVPLSPIPIPPIPPPTQVRLSKKSSIASEIDRDPVQIVAPVNPPTTVATPSTGVSGKNSKRRKLY